LLRSCLLVLSFLFAPVAFAEPLVLSVTSAEAMKDRVTGEPIIAFSMAEKSAAAFARLTAANVGRTLEIRLDGVTVSAPIIREPILDGSGAIAGNLDGVDVVDLAARIASGEVTVEVEVVDP
jgi:preprotein translocase subunit SecD